MISIDGIRFQCESLVENLSYDEAFLILQKLFLENPDLEELIQETAIKVVSNVDAEEIANCLYDDLISLDMEELSNRSGSSRYGYVDPNDESWVMFEEAVEPYISEMRKYHQREMPHAVKVYCIGIIEGLVMFKKADTDFLEWVADAPLDYISYVVDEYKELLPDVDDVEEVVEVVEALVG